MRSFSSLVLVLCENHGFDQVKDLQSHRLIAERGAILTNYFSVTRPSGPNYRSIIAGNYWTHDELLGQQHPTITTQTGVPTTIWNYRGRPAARHNPFADLRSPVTTVDEMDLETLPGSCLLYVGMSDDNNAHSGPLAVADQNLLALIDQLDHSAWFHRAVDGRYPLLCLTWDEAYTATNQVFAGFFGQGVTPGASSADPLNHFSLCRLLCENWDSPPLEHAATAAPIMGIWTG